LLFVKLNYKLFVKTNKGKVSENTIAGSDTRVQGPACHEGGRLAAIPFCNLFFMEAHRAMIPTRLAIT
jgi:hypothetical protein